MELLDKDKEFLKEYKKHATYTLSFNDMVFISIGISFITMIISVFTGNDTLFLLMFGTPIIFSPIVYEVANPIIRRKRKKSFYLNCGISEQEAETRYNVLSNIESSYSIPLLQRFCKLNPYAKSSQSNLLKKWFCLEDESITEYCFNRKFDKKDWNNAVEKLKEAELVTKKTFIYKIFKLVILEDGIHNDEWNLLMQLITELQFNKHYINYFKDRYESLRTEFEYEKRESSSKNNRSNYSLKEYFAILGLSENATDKEIRRAYHDLALQHHPDLPKNADRMEECEKMMMKINEAYEKVRG